MSDSPMRSAAPVAGTTTGYRPFSLFSDDLTLAPFAQSRLGWCLMGWDCQVRGLLPKAHFATVYAKPAGRPVVDDFITEVSQDTWILFPWDT